MKKILFVMAAALLTACQSYDERLPNDVAIVKFNVGGFAPMTRTALAESDMTNIWLFDFVGDDEVQAAHLTDLSSPSLSMTYGHHRVCLVASRGSEPDVDVTTKTVTWDIPRDTFWGEIDLDVTATSNETAVNVTLNRVATKLKITITDDVPTGIAKVSVTPTAWYYSLNYETGEAAGELQKERSIDVPASYVGTSGTLVVNFFGISDSGEWMTDVLVKATNESGAVIGQAVISDAPFVRNRSTEYSGPLFGGESGWNVTINDVWENAFAGTW